MKMGGRDRGHRERHTREPHTALARGVDERIPVADGVDQTVAFAEPIHQGSVKLLLVFVDAGQLGLSRPAVSSVAC